MYKKSHTIMGWRLLILSTAVFLRLYKLASIPPGLTHDEADHGITAWSIANDGVRDLYFTIGYGREPLYDYVTAVLMKITGPTYLAGRLIAAWAGILLVAAMYRWVRDAFDERTALFTAAGIAVGFWAMATSRQALRSELLPLLFTLAMVFYWKGVASSKLQVASSKWALFVISGAFLGLTFYTYIPSRGMWFVFPLLFGFGLLMQRATWRRLWKQTAVTLSISLLIAAPLFNYLQTHPNTEGRIDELKTPITAVFNSNFTPLLQNIIDGIKIIGIDGDWIARYNIPHQPLLPPVMAILFTIGLFWAIWRAIQRVAPTAYFAAIIWLLAGLAPVLITGPEWSFTQAMGMQPVLYLFPALPLAWLGQWVTGRWKRPFSIGVVGLFGITAVFTIHSYFNIWANDPAVRVQYESTTVTAMKWLNTLPASYCTASSTEIVDPEAVGVSQAALSTIAPSPFHTPALAKMTMYNPAVNLHYFDARTTLLLPGKLHSTRILPGFTPISPAMERYWRVTSPYHIIQLHPNDEDSPLEVYSVSRDYTLELWADQFTLDEPASNEYLDFLGYDLQTQTVAAGDVAQIATLWQIKRPLSQANLFTHIQGADRAPIAQADRLDVPGEGWQTGDYFIQLHEIRIPPETPSGHYPIALGLCQRNATNCTRIDDLIQLKAEIEIE